MVLGSIAGSLLVRKAASLAFEKKKRATLTTNIIECLGERCLVIPQLSFFLTSKYILSRKTS